MQFIGNYKDWVDDQWIEYMMKNDGTPRPSGGRNPNSEEFKNAEKLGYDLSQTYWYIYEPDTFPFNVIPPIEIQDQTFIWWFIKMLPGNKMPMHKDPHAVNEKNSKRYWMPLQDYEPGHVFIYEDELATHYKKGDLFVYDDSKALHGACNIGWSPRLIACFSSFDQN
jgi:hypothetical protein